jgi:exosome complex component RRP4
MAITILPPVVEDVNSPPPDSDFDSMSIDSDGGVDLTSRGGSRPSKRPRLVEGTKIGAGIVTPGEVVTDDPQWMRLVLPTFGLRYFAHFRLLPRKVQDCH